VRECVPAELGEESGGPGWRSCRQQGPHTVPSWVRGPDTGRAPPNWDETLCGFNSYSGLAQDSSGWGCISWVREPSSPVCFLTGRGMASKNHNQGV